MAFIWLFPLTQVTHKKENSESIWCKYDYNSPHTNGMMFIDQKVFATTGLAEQLMACFKAFWQSTAQELFWYVIKFQSMSQPFKMQRLEFNFEVLPLTDPTGEPGPHTHSAQAALVFG